MFVVVAETVLLVEVIVKFVVEVAARFVNDFIAYFVMEGI
jgi:hypothetical protein